MADSKILVTGATGNVGSALLPLLQSDISRVIAGSTHGHAVGTTPGRKIDFNEPAQLAGAFADIDIAFIVIPLHPNMVQMGANVAMAAKSAGVKHLIRVSGAGADPASPFAVGRVQGETDRYLIESGIPTTLLRPKNFMQNFSNFLANMIKHGSFYSSQGEGMIPFIDVRDIAAVAAEVLKNPSAHAGQAYVLTGAELLTNRDALNLISKAIGRTIDLIDIPEEAAVKSMRDTGMPEFVVEVMSSLNQVIAAGYVAELTDTVERTTGHKPRSFNDYVKEYADVWR